MRPEVVIFVTYKKSVLFLTITHLTEAGMIFYVEKQPIIVCDWKGRARSLFMLINKLPSDWFAIVFEIPTPVARISQKNKKKTSQENLIFYYLYQMSIFKNIQFNISWSIS